MSMSQILSSKLPPFLSFQYPSKKSSGGAPDIPPPKSIRIPDANAEILRTSVERHRQCQMSPLVHQLLTKGEIKLPVLMEDEKQAQLPLLHHLYQVRI